MNIHLRSVFNANNILLLALVLIVFFVPVLPIPFHYPSYNILFSIIFFTSAAALQTERKKLIMAAAAVLIILEWVLIRLDHPLLSLVARIPQVVFFIYIVFGLIRHTASARKVTERVIVDSISGYLLLGLMYGIILFALFRLHPDALRFPDGAVDPSLTRQKMSDIIYYTFITYTTTGYGDILPATPSVKAFATFISTTGQLYIAIIIALLVGKFASTNLKIES